MMTINVKFCWLNPESNKDLLLPRYHSDNASGVDVSAAITGSVILQPGQIQLLPSGFSVAIPTGYEIQVRSRSGLAIKHGITVINSPGTIDADYRGEVRIGLINLGSEPFIINRGDRIAQLVLTPVMRINFEIMATLDNTSRGDGGFGHTGQ